MWHKESISHKCLIGEGSIDFYLSGERGFSSPLFSIPESRKPCIHAALSNVEFGGCRNGLAFHNTQKNSMERASYIDSRLSTSTTPSWSARQGSNWTPFSGYGHTMDHSFYIWHENYIWAATKHKQTFLCPNGWVPHRLCTPVVNC